MSSEKFQGSCLCGAIRYEVREMLSHMAHCHCCMCRKFHGAAFSTFGVAKRADFTWLQGENRLKTYRSEQGVERQFCSECGSSMTFAAADSDGSVVEFTLGTLDSDIPHRPDAHIYTRYKADWHELNDGLPQHAEGRDDKD